MSAVLVVAIVGAACGWRFGILEADWAKQRADDHVHDPLPHPLLWVLRLFIALVIAILIDGFEWRSLWLAIAFMAALATAHRLGYNRRTRMNGLSRTREWWYMGSCRRYIDDSWYDTLCWIISARRIDARRDSGLTHGGSRCLLIRPWSYAMPFFIAAAIESTALACAIALH